MNTIINMKRGDLAWLPSQTALLSFADPDDPKSDVREWCYPKEPKHVLVLKDLDETYYLIEYRGQQWAVPKRLLYRS